MSRFFGWGVLGAAAFLVVVGVVSLLVEGGKPKFRSPVKDAASVVSPGGWVVGWRGPVGTAVSAPIDGVLSKRIRSPRNGPTDCRSHDFGRVVWTEEEGGVLVFALSGVDWEAAPGAVRKGDLLGSLAACPGGEPSVLMFAVWSRAGRAEAPVLWQRRWEAPLGGNELDWGRLMAFLARSAGPEAVSDFPRR